MHVAGSLMTTLLHHFMQYRKFPERAATVCLKFLTAACLNTGSVLPGGFQFDGDPGRGSWTPCRRTVRPNFTDDGGGGARASADKEH